MAKSISLHVGGVPYNFEDDYVAALRRSIYFIRESYLFVFITQGDETLHTFNELRAASAALDAGFTDFDLVAEAHHATRKARPEFFTAVA